MVPKIIDLRDFSASECSDISIGLMSELCHVIWAFAQQKNSSTAKGFLWRTM